MMGKYWSVFLLAGLGIAALADPRRAQYFRSAAPWVTIAVGAILFAPHVAWLVGQDFAPFTYAVVAHQSTLARAALSGLGFLLGIAGYIAPAVVLSALVTRPSIAAVGDTLWPREPARRFALIAFAAAVAAAGARRAAVQGRDRVALGDVRDDLAAGGAAVLAARRRHAPRRRMAARRRNRLSGRDGARGAVHRGLDPPRGRAELRHALSPARAGDRPHLARERQRAAALHRQLHQHHQRRVVLSARQALDARHRRSALDAMVGCRKRRALRHRAGLPRGGSDLHAFPQSARRRPAAPRGDALAPRTGACPTSRCATSSWWCRPQNENAPPVAGHFWECGERSSSDSDRS